MKRCIRRLLLVAFAAGFSISVYAQSINLDMKNVPLINVLNEITRTTGYKFVYSDNMNAVLRNQVTVKSDGEKLTEVLDKILKGLGIAYKIDGKHVAINFAEKVADLSIKASEEVAGLVKDEYDMPLAGVVVSIRNKNEYTVSDAGGKFVLSTAKKGDVLVFSCVGYSEKEIAVSNAAMIVVMSEDVQMLDDVVVTGYQTISRERATGSFIKVTSEDLAIKPVTNISEALVGMVPGMVANNNRFVIRGVGTLQGQNDIDPLVVIDGFPVQGYSNGADPFEMVNPNDVESITVLKDAAATSIYGARAANGVIVITTKKAKSQDKININFDARVTVSSKYDLDYYMDFADGQTQLDYMLQMEKYSTIFDFDPYSDPSDPKIYVPEMTKLIWEYKRGGMISEAEFNSGIERLMDNEGKWIDDYNKYLFQNAIRQQYNLNINGASKKNSYYFSAVYNRETGSSIGDSGNRILLSFSDTYKILDNLSISMGITANYRNNTDNGVDVSSISDFTTPFTRLVDEEGDYLHVPAKSGWNALTVYEPIYREKYEGKVPVSWEYNPAQEIERHNYTSSTVGTRIQGSIDYKPVEFINISLKGQYESNNSQSKSELYENSFTIRDYVNMYSVLNPTTGNYDTHFPSGGRISKSGSQYSSYNIRGQIDFNKTFAEKHNITAMLIGEMSSATTENIPSYTAYGYNPITNAVITTPDYINRVECIYGYQTYYPFSGLGTLSTRDDRFLSAGANFAYSYDNRYTLSASARSDASNFIADDVRKKFSPFWSVGFVWNASRERFMSEIDWIDELRVRGSYGTAGVAAGKNSMSTLTTVSTRPGSVIYSNNEPYNTISLKGNPTLTWEKSRTINAGVDFSFFKGRLYGSVEYYNRYSYDVLAQASVPYIAQSTATLTYNNAAIQNSGIELQLGSMQKIADRITWKGDFNLAYNRNIVKEYNVIPTYPGGTYVVGYPMSPLWGYKLAGYTSEGLLKLEGKDGQVIDVVDRASTHYYDKLESGQQPEENNWKRYYGTIVAPVNMGFTNTFEIYGFTLSFMITGKFGHKFSYSNSIYPSYGDCGLRSFAADALAMDRSGYTAGYHTFPVLNETNTDMFNAGFLYGYSSNLYNSADWHIRSASHIRLNNLNQ